MDWIEFRPLRSRDVRHLLRLFERPGDGYGPTANAALEPLLMRLIDEQALRGPGMERRRPAGASHGELVAAALTGFVDLSLGRAWLAAPPADLVDHLLRCEGRGDRVLLRPDDVAGRNAGEGLTLVFFAFRIPDLDSVAKTHVITALPSIFRLFHAGYYCPIALHPRALDATTNEMLRRHSFRPLDESSRVWGLELRDLDAAPYNMLSCLNRRPPPRFAFSPGEKDQLFRALTGASDAEIADDFGVSPETVKKRWRSIYERVATDEELALLPRVDVEDAKRGPEKRKILLRYLEHHVEELRPYRRQ